MYYIIYRYAQTESFTRRPSSAEEWKKKKLQLYKYPPYVYAYRVPYNKMHVYMYIYMRRRPTDADAIVIIDVCRLQRYLIFFYFLYIHCTGISVCPVYTAPMPPASVASRSSAVCETMTIVADTRRKSAAAVASTGIFV